MRLPTVIGRHDRFIAIHRRTRGGRPASDAPASVATPQSSIYPPIPVDRVPDFKRLAYN
jgi:hypothetical protein